MSRSARGRIGVRIVHQCAILQLLLFVSPVLAESQKIDLNGDWAYTGFTGKSINKITHKGSSVNGVLVLPSDVGRDTYGFVPGDWSLRCRLEGRSLQGTIHLRWPLSFKKKCPHLWDTSGTLEATIQPDGNTITGRYEWINYDEDCKIIGKESRQFTLTRVPPDPIQPTSRVKEIQFFQRVDGTLKQVDRLYVRGAFYLKVIFDKKPKQLRRTVRLTFDNGQIKSIAVSESRDDPKLFDSAPQHLTQLAHFPNAPRPPDPDPPEAEGPQQKYPSRMTVRLKYEEVLEGPSEGASTSVEAKLDGVSKRVGIVQRGATKRCTVDIPLKLKLKKAEGEKPETLYLEVGGHNLKIDERMPRASAAAVRAEASAVEKRLKEWRKPIVDEFRTEQWIKEAMATVKIEKPFEELEKLSRPTVILSLDRALDLSGKPLEMTIRRLYARLMQKCALEVRMAGLMERIKKSSANADRGEKLHTLLESKKDVIKKLDTELRNYGWVLADADLATFDPVPLRKKIEEAKTKIPQAEKKLKEAQKKVLVKVGDTIEYARRPGPGVKNAFKHREAILKGAALRREALNNPTNLDEETKKLLRRLIKEREAEAAAIQKIIDDRTSFSKREVERLRKEVAGLEKEVKEGLETRDRARERKREFQRKFYDTRRTYNDLIKEIQAGADPAMKLLEFKPLASDTSAITADELFDAANDLEFATVAVERLRQAQSAEVKADLDAYFTAQRGHTYLMKNVAAAMKSAIQEGRAAAIEGGRKDKDEETYKLFVKELDKVKGVYDEAAKLLSDFDSRLEKFEYFLKYATSSKGEKLVKKLRDEMETLGNAAKKVSTLLEYADEIKKLVNLYEEGKPVDFLKYSLEAAKKVAGKLPVRGNVMGQFLEFYAKAAEASIEAAHAIRDSRVQQELLIAFNSNSRGNPDYRLYTKAQIKSALQTGHYAYDHEETLARLTTIWQLHRLMYLMGHADQCVEIWDRGGLRY